MPERPAGDDLDSAQLANPRAERVKRVAALAGRSARSRAGLFLVEGPQGVREAVLFAASRVLAYNEVAPPDTFNAQRFTISQLRAYAADQTPPGRVLSISQALFDPGDIAALTAQLAQTQRDLQSARETNSRIMEGNTAQERDRVAVITQLRNENNALVARLTQAQGTLDQIASAARLGTPAAAIAGGGTPPRPVVTTTAAAPEARIHTVVEGDSLSRISMRYYGTPNRWQEIYNANRDVLQASSTLRVGMQLRIP